MPRLPLRRGFLIATFLSLLFLASTAYTSVVTLMDRIQSTDVMKAVSGDMWSAKIAGQMVYFGVAQILLHVAMGALAWLLALACVAIWPVTRVKFTRIIVGWFCLLAAAALAYNALWYPRTFFGAHYYDYMVRQVGPVPRRPAGLWLGTARCLRNSRSQVGSWRCERMHSSRQKRWLTGCCSRRSAGDRPGMLVDRYSQVARAQDKRDKPHVILLGIDSLRLDELESIRRHPRQHIRISIGFSRMPTSSRMRRRPWRARSAPGWPSSPGAVRR